MVEEDELAKPQVTGLVVWCPECRASYQVDLISSWSGSCPAGRGYVKAVDDYGSLVVEGEFRCSTCRRIFPFTIY